MNCTRSNGNDVYGLSAPRRYRTSPSRGSISERGRQRCHRARTRSPSRHVTTAASTSSTDRRLHHYRQQHGRPTARSVCSDRLLVASGGDGGRIHIAPATPTAQTSLTGCTGLSAVHRRQHGDLDGRAGSRRERSLNRGFIKIEMQATTLAQPAGLAGRHGGDSEPGSCRAGERARAHCDPTPNAVIRLYHVRDNSWAASALLPPATAASTRTTTGPTCCTTRARETSATRRPIRPITPWRSAG